MMLSASLTRSRIWSRRSTRLLVLPRLLKIAPSRWRVRSSLCFKALDLFRGIMHSEALVVNRVQGTIDIWAFFFSKAATAVRSISQTGNAWLNFF